METMTKHTPGPWSIGFASDDSKVQIISADGYHLAYVEQDPIYPNARLIAAAPEMLECLQDVIEWLTSGKVDGVGFDHAQVEDTIRAAIKKAEGRTP